MRRFGLKRSALFALLSIVVYLWVRNRYPKCDSRPYFCKDGRIMSRKGPLCQAPCLANPSEKLATTILWNAPMHSWTGTASEAVNFVVPLSGLLPNISLVGGYAREYVEELQLADATVINSLRETAQVLDSKVQTPNHTKRGWTILVTQYDPGTYGADLHRYAHHKFDYKIGRAMFETTGIPVGWTEQCSKMDEIWIPSRWGKARFVAAGVDEAKLKVVPESININEFNPKRVSKIDPTIMPRPKNTNTSFGFLSVFKWEVRKNYDTLLMAFLQEFGTNPNVTLYVRSGDSKQRLDNYLDQVIVPRIRKTGAFVQWHFGANVVWVPKVAQEDYPSLYASADAFVLPTHGEGWCRPVMEAMAMGLPVITTHWSGLTDLVSEQTALLLHPSGMEPAYPDEPGIINFDDQGNHLWASISIEDLRKVMRYAATTANKHLIKAIGSSGKDFVTTHYSREVVAKQINKRLHIIQAVLSSAKNAELADMEPSS